MGIKARAEIVRKGGDRFKIPVEACSFAIGSDTPTKDFPNCHSNENTPQSRTHIHLKKWAAQPGDQLHLQIYDELNHFFTLERYIKIKRHGLGGNLSFPILSVQRSGNHPGSLGAGISYTGRYIQPEKSLLNELGWGVNFSFLDFDPHQKIEIGLAIVFSFPDDIFQIGVGKNLTIKRDATYYLLGINLPGIKEKAGL